jgi:hypothetical protein
MAKRVFSRALKNSMPLNHEKHESAYPLRLLRVLVV